MLCLGLDIYWSRPWSVQANLELFEEPRSSVKVSQLRHCVYEAFCTYFACICIRLASLSPKTSIFWSFYYTVEKYMLIKHVVGCCTSCSCRTLVTAVWRCWSMKLNSTALLHWVSLYECTVLCTYVLMHACVYMYCLYVQILYVNGIRVSVHINVVSTCKWWLPQHWLLIILWD